ncbi:hypothetical protein KBB89_01880 [Candidatus Gracilibacteria bacterium]|nr:hypothetical protein [Candidatus Gracilibacteria bacterium]
MRFIKSIGVWYNYGKNEEYAETSPEAVRYIGNYLVKYDLDRSVLYDFGSSQGSLIFSLLKICKNLKTVGIERDSFKNFGANLANKFHRYKHAPLFLKEDFMKTDISKADIIFIYVPRILLPKLSKKIQKEGKKNTKVILYRISFDNWKPTEIIQLDGYDKNPDNKISIYTCHEI